MAKIPSRVAESMKKQMKAELEGSEIEKNYNLDNFCNCIVDGIQLTFTAKELMLSNINETDKYQTITDSCMILSKK